MSNKFEKVSFAEFCKGAGINKDKEESKNIYEKIILPQRKTKGSAGFDIHSPFPFTLNPEESIVIATGIKVKINDGYFLTIVPRSSLGFNYRLQLNNTWAVVDQDYYGNKENSGQIFISMMNDSRTGKILKVNPNDSIAQAIFLSYGITEDDNVFSERQGGIGSTNR